MFKWLFLYWYNTTDTPSSISKINLWSYINIRIFKAKISCSIAYFILNLNNLELKKLKIFFKNSYYDYVYFKSIFSIVFLITAIIVYMCI